MGKRCPQSTTENFCQTEWVNIANLSCGMPTDSSQREIECKNCLDLCDSGFVFSFILVFHKPFLIFPEINFNFLPPRTAPHSFTLFTFERKYLSVGQIILIQEDVSCVGKVR